MSNPTVSYPTPVVEDSPAVGLVFPVDGSGLRFDAAYPLTFPPIPPDPGTLAALFPTIMPQVEQIVYQAVNDACNTRAIFPDSGLGLPFPVTFNVPPDISLFRGMDGTYLAAGGHHAPVVPIPVVRGWPAYPGQVPQIGVAEMTVAEDDGNATLNAGFAGDVCATDGFGNVTATAAYYAQEVVITVVVELIHTNRDERDRLHDQLYRVLNPLKHVIPRVTSLVRRVKLSSEKQDLPVDEQPVTMYISLFTVETQAEMLVPSEIETAGIVTELDVTVTPSPPEPD